MPLTIARTSCRIPGARSIAAYALVLALAIGASPAEAATALGVSPSSIDRFEAGDVVVSVTGLAAGESVVLRFVADADADGIIDAEDDTVYTTIVTDNDLREAGVGDLLDGDPTPGALSFSLRGFLPFSFPYPAGAYVVEASGSAGSGTATTSFSVSASGGGLVVSGQVFDDLAAPLPGALVVLSPLQSECEAPMLSAFGDAEGRYAIPLEEDPACRHRLVMAAKPGYATRVEAMPSLRIDAAEALDAVNLALETASTTITGRVLYAEDDGSPASEGVPGATVVADSEEFFAIAFADHQGDYSLEVLQGDYELSLDTLGALALAGALADESAAVALSAASSTTADDLLAGRANASVSGSVRDAAGLPLTGHALEGYRNAWPCASECYESFALSDAAGSYTMPLRAPEAPSSWTWSVEPRSLLEGAIIAIGEGEIVAGDAISGADLDYQAPTRYVRGRFYARGGDQVEGLCLKGSTMSGNQRYVSRAQAGCSGEYALPAFDGNWELAFEPDATLGALRDLDTSPVRRNVDVSGADVEDANLVLGGALSTPALATIEPDAVQPGGQLLLTGRAIPENPSVTVGGTSVSVIAARPDLGRVLVELPASFPPGAGVHDVVMADSLSGVESTPLCVEVEEGLADQSCAIAVNVAAPSSGLAIAVNAEGNFVGGASYDAGAENYALSLPAEAGYDIMFLPGPDETSLQWGQLEAVACGSSDQWYAYTEGVATSGLVLDAEGQPVADAEVSFESGESFVGMTNTNAEGAYAIGLPQGSFERFVLAPTGSRLVSSAGDVVDISAPIPGSQGLANVTLETGVVVTGRVVDSFDRGLGGEVMGQTQSGYSGRGVVETCTGVFSVALNSSAEQILSFENWELGLAAELHSVTPLSDVVLPFDVPLYDSGPFEEPEGLPRFGHLSTLLGRVGETLLLEGELPPATTSVEVLFSDGQGGTLTGGDTLFDVARGLVTTTVPSGVAEGPLVVRVEGVDAPELDFAMAEGAALSLPYTMSGVVRDSSLAPVEGALVVTLVSVEELGECEGDIKVAAVVASDASGGYSAPLAAGANYVLVLPPADHAPLAATALLELADVQSSGSHDFDLPEGEEIALEVIVRDEFGNPLAVPFARVLVEGDAGLDFRVTDANGIARVRVPAGSYEVQVAGPLGSRLMLSEGSSNTAPGSNNTPASVELTSGRIVAFAVQDESGAPLAGAEGGIGFDQGGQWTTSFEATLTRGGLFVGAGPQNQQLSAEVWSGRDTLSDPGQSIEGGSVDLVIHPRLEASAAGVVRGQVLDAATLSPISTHVGLHIPDGSGWPQWVAGQSTCSDGSFAIKSAAGDFLLGAHNGGDSTWYEGWWSSTGTRTCHDDASWVGVIAGETTSDLNVELGRSTTISGEVLEYGTAASGTWFEARGGALGSCARGASVDDFGQASVRVPAGSGFRVSASGHPNYPELCFERESGCQSYTPVDASDLASPPSVRLVFGNPPPALGESGFEQITVEHDAGTGELMLVFEDLQQTRPELVVEGYHVYEGSPASFSSPTTSRCFIPQHELVDLGVELSYRLVPAASPTWYLVSAWNSADEGALGSNRALDERCGVAPIESASESEDELGGGGSFDGALGSMPSPAGTLMRGARPRPESADQRARPRRSPAPARFVSERALFEATPDWGEVPGSDEGLRARARALESLGMLVSFHAEEGRALISRSAWSVLSERARRGIARTLLEHSKAQDGRRRVELFDEEGEKLARQSSFWGYREYTTP